MPRADGASKVTEMNKYVVHNMVEYIKTQAEFPFDALDVEESLEEVLGYFGFHPQLDVATREQLLADLLPLALGAELGEMQHLAESSNAAETLCFPARVLGQHPRMSPAQFMEKMRLA
jgi:hypothetical protein